MFSSTIIPTINRPTLTRAVCSVLTQEFSADDFEVIVVNDSGEPLPASDWQSSPRVRVFDTQRSDRSVARNTGAAMARGRFLHFLDDDDVLLPGALAAFWQLHHVSDAQWLFGSYQSVNDAGQQLRVFRPEIDGNIFPMLIAGESIPFQASLLDANLFFGVTGFDPEFHMSEDRELGRRLGLHSSVASTSTLVASIRVGERCSSTRGRWHLRPEVDRAGRENALNARTAFARLRCARVSSYWYGRVSRAYFASMIWNLKRRKIMTAINRAALGSLLATSHIFAGDFWVGWGYRFKQSYDQ